LVFIILSFRLNSFFSYELVKYCLFCFLQESWAWTESNDGWRWYEKVYALNTLSRNKGISQKALQAAGYRHMRDMSLRFRRYRRSTIHLLQTHFSCNLLTRLDEEKWGGFSFYLNCSCFNKVYLFVLKSCPYCR